MYQIADKCKSVLDALDEKLSRLLSPLEIILVGLLLIGCIVFKTNDTQYPVNVTSSYEILSERERKLFIPLDMRVELCKSSPECSIMAEALVYESRSESEKGAVAVAHVILNRMNSHRWGDSVKDVVYQRHQFSYTEAEQQNTPSEKDWRRAYLLSWEVLEGLVASPVGNADHYHATYVKPNWAKEMEYVSTIDSHKFYKE